MSLRHPRKVGKNELEGKIQTYDELKRIRGKSNMERRVKNHFEAETYPMDDKHLKETEGPRIEQTGKVGFPKKKKGTF